jgi:hypothetical protein
VEVEVKKQGRGRTWGNTRVVHRHVGNNFWAFVDVGLAWVFFLLWLFVFGV